MSKRLRGNNGVGYAPNSFLTITPAAVVSNARLESSKVESLRAENINPLWPHAKVDHPKYLPARKGIIAFSVLATEDSYLNNIVGNSSDTPSFYKQMSAFNLELDSIGYFSQLNSLGIRPATGGATSVYDAQRSFLRAIRPVGLIVSDIENASNLRHLGNTIMHDFGKMTIPNVGCNDIDQYSYISADVATEQGIEKYGLRKIDSFEPDCFTLVPTPTKTVNNTIEFTAQYLEDDFRNGQHSQGVLKLVRGALGIAACIGGDIANRQIKRLPDVTVPATTSPDVASYAQAAFITANRLALLSIDEEYDKDFMDAVETVKTTTTNGAAAKYQDNALMFDYTMNSSAHSDTLEKIISRVSTNNVVNRFKIGHPNTFSDDVLGKLSDAFDINRGIRNLVLGFADILTISQSLRIGMALTPASVGRDFDIAVQM